MLRLLHIGKFYPPQRGGIETHVRDLATRQTKLAQVNVVVSSSTTRSSRELTEGVWVTRVGRLGTLASMPICPGLIAAIRACPADLIHLHTPNPGAALALLLSGHHGKVVVTHHADTLGRKVLRALAHPFEREVMDRASAIITTSLRYLDSSEELRPYREKCHVIPLGIDLANNEGFNGDGPNDSERRQLVSVGRLVPYKGFDVLIRAMEKVDARLTLIGTGPEEARLRKMIVKQGLPDRVELLGRVKDLGPYLRKASVFVLPSITRAEAFGLVQLEAMAAGLPVINTWLDSGVPEISVDGETGMTVEPGDPDAMADAIEFLLSNDEVRRRLAAAARKKVREEFTADLMAQRTLEVYASVLGGF